MTALTDSRSSHSFHMNISFRPSISLSYELHRDLGPLWGSKPTNSIIFNETEKDHAACHLVNFRNEIKLNTQTPLKVVEK